MEVSDEVEMEFLLGSGSRATLNGPDIASAVVCPGSSEGSSSRFCRGCGDTPRRSGLAFKSERSASLGSAGIDEEEREPVERLRFSLCV